MTEKASKVSQQTKSLTCLYLPPAEPGYIYPFENSEEVNSSGSTLFFNAAMSVCCDYH